VQSAAISDLPPLGHGFLNGGFRLKGPAITESPELKAEQRAVSPGYFHTLSIPLLAGRPFSAQDSASAQPVVIVSERFAHRWFARKEALGEAVFLLGKWRTIIGVAANTKMMPYNTVAWRSVPQIYLPELQASGFGSNPVTRSIEMSIRSTRPLIREEFQHLLTNINPNAALAEFQPLTELVAEATRQPDLRSILLGIFSAISLALASIGIFGTLSQFVKQRRREIGIRSALGATPSDLLRSVMLRGLLLASVGVISGALISLAASRVVARLLYGMKPVDPIAFLTAGFLLLLVAGLASLIPARRAAALDPITVLREE
jgi:putative ABC transport system permease protein